MFSVRGSFILLGLSWLFCNGCISTHLWSVEEFETAKITKAEDARIYLVEDNRDIEQVVFKYRTKNEDRGWFESGAFPAYDQGCFSSQRRFGLDRFTYFRGLKEISDSPFATRLNPVHVRLLRYPTEAGGFGEFMLEALMLKNVKYPRGRRAGDSLQVFCSMDFYQITDDKITFLTEEQGAHFAATDPPKNFDDEMFYLGFGRRAKQQWDLLQGKCFQKFKDAKVHYDAVYPVGWIDSQGEIRTERFSENSQRKREQLKAECAAVVLGLKQNIGDIKYIQIDFNVIQYGYLLANSFNRKDLHGSYKTDYPFMCPGKLCHELNIAVNGYFPFVSDCTTSSATQVIDGPSPEVLLEFHTLEPRYKYSLPTRVVLTPVTAVVDVVTYPFVWLFMVTILSLACC